MTRQTLPSFMARRGWQIALAFTVVVGWAWRTAQAEDLLPPQQVIHDTSEQLKERLRREGVKTDFPRANRVVKEIIEPHVDFDRVSALVLGSHWRTTTQEHRQRFKEEFRTLLIRTYATAQIEFVDWKINYLPMQLSPQDMKTVVRTLIIRPGGQPAAVDYRMLKVGGEWKVYDVIIEGVSLVNNYRTEFDADLAHNGNSMDALLKRMNERNSQALKEPVKPGSVSASPRKS